MKVCVDLQAGLGQTGGIGRYVRELFRHLGREAGEGERVEGFCFDFHRRYRGAEWARGGRVRACRWMPGRIAQAAWKRVHAPPFDWYAGEADVYHFPNFIRPPLGKGKRSVVTIHDLSFMRMPETTEKKNLAWLMGEIRRTAETADAILTDSRFSAGEIHELLGVEKERIFPVWLGLDSFPAPPGEEEAAALRRELGLERPYLLMVGTIEPRKNIPFLVKVFEEMRDFDGELVLVGGLGWKTEGILKAIEDSPRRERIRRLGGIRDDQLAAVYAGAAAFVFPSRYEGFGFPPLEAMARGVPVVCARNSSLPEVLGEAPRWVDGFETGEWAEAVRGVLGDGEGRERMRKAGVEQAGRFTWAETARETWEVYRRALGGAEGKVTGLRCALRAGT